MIKLLVIPILLVSMMLGGCGGSASGAFSSDDPVADPGPEPEPPIENAFWNVDDRDSDIVISTDGREISGRGGVRTKHSVGPEEGYFYVEFNTADAAAFFSVGAATLDSELGAFVTEGREDTLFPSNWPDRVGIAIDYRGLTPIIYFLQRENGTQTNLRSVIRDDWYGQRVAIVFATEATEEPFRAELQRDSFLIDFEAGVAALNLDANIGLIPGWPSDDASPSISISSNATVVESGSPITITAVAEDAEDGDLSTAVEWLVNSTPSGTGASFVVTPELGRQKISARVIDSFGQESNTTSIFVQAIDDTSSDIDLDSLTYAQEMALGTDPGKRDTDEDGIPDNEETIYGTNPLEADSDGDSMSDGYEVDNQLNPLSNDANEDLDSDGASNLAEFNDKRKANNPNDYPNIGSISFSTVAGTITETNLNFSISGSGTNISQGDIAANPSSGWHYFEGKRLVAPGNFGFGIVSASYDPATSVGDTNQSISVSSQGQVIYEGNIVATFETDPSELDTYGLAIDYSSNNPVLHIVLSPFQHDYEILDPITLTGITEAIFIAVYGESQGGEPQQQINIGSNKNDVPFLMSPRYLLTHAGFSSARTMPEGWGSEFAFEPLQQPKIEDDVYFVKDRRVHPGLYLSEDKLSASYLVDHKMGILANQGMYGQFWYWEARRETAPANYGFGLNNPHAFLMPYCCVNTSLEEVAPSNSINALGGIWRNLVFQLALPFEAEENEYYGFAVDFRGEYPIVYPIANDEVLAEQHLTDFLTTPIYPMIYGNRAGQGFGASNTGNFGAEPFENDARQALIDHGVDVSEFKEGWGIYAE